MQKFFERRTDWVVTTLKPAFRRRKTPLPWCAIMVELEKDSLLSPAARAILAVNDGSAYAALVVQGAGSAAAGTLLRKARPADLLTQPPRRQDAASALLAGLWLWHDFLDHSHTLSQAIHSETGSYWHAIMHRREGDFGNAKYWYARCRNHPALAAMASKAASVLQQPEYVDVARTFFRGGWSPEALVDLAEESYRKPVESPERRLAVDLQRLEWAAVFDETIREATGG